VIEISSLKEVKGVCKKCKSEICTKCKNKYHHNIDCKNAIDEEFKQWADKKQVQSCKACGMLAEKV